MDERGAKAIVEEMLRCQQEGDDTFLDLVAADMVNHAAGPQGRDGLAGILRTPRPRPRAGHPRTASAHR
jgi:lactoylglutathione lyase